MPQNNDALFWALIETAVDGIIVIDTRGNVQVCSGVCEKLSSYRPGEVVGRRRDGSTFPMYPSVGEGDGNRVFVGSIHDLTPLRAVVARCEDVNSLPAPIVRSSDDAILSKTLDATITGWNASAEQTFGYAAVEAIGMNIAILIPTDRFAGLEPDLPPILIDKIQIQQVLINLMRNAIEAMQTADMREPAIATAVTILALPELRPDAAFRFCEPFVGQREAA